MMSFAHYFCFDFLPNFALENPDVFFEQPELEEAIMRAWNSGANQAERTAPPKSVLWKSSNERVLALLFKRAPRARDCYGVAAVQSLKGKRNARILFWEKMESGQCWAYLTPKGDRVFVKEMAHCDPEKFLNWCKKEASKL